MSRNLLFIDFDLTLKRDLFNDKILETYDLINDYIKNKSQYGLEFWKSIWLKNVEDSLMILLLINPKFDFDKEFDNLINTLNKIKISSLYYQFRTGKRKPDKLENIYLYLGKKTIKEKIGDYSFNITPYSFNQSNNTAAYKLYNGISKKLADEKDFSKLIIYGRTSSPISIFCHKYFDDIFCFVPCPVVYNNMLLDLRENQIDNIKLLEEEKNKFIPSQVSGFNNFLLLLSPGYQGLPKSILDNIIEDHNIERIFLLYCNRNKLNRDLQYISNKRRMNIISEDIFDLFPNTKYCELFLQVNFIK